MREVFTDEFMTYVIESCKQVKIVRKRFWRGCKLFLRVMALYSDGLEYLIFER